MLSESLPTWKHQLKQEMMTLYTVKGKELILTYVMTLIKASACEADATQLIFEQLWVPYPIYQTCWEGFHKSFAACPLMQ